MGIHLGKWIKGWFKKPSATNASTPPGDASGTGQLGDGTDATGTDATAHKTNFWDFLGTAVGGLLGGSGGGSSGGLLGSVLPGADGAVSDIGSAADEVAKTMKVVKIVLGITGVLLVVYLFKSLKNKRGS